MQFRISREEMLQFNQFNAGSVTLDSLDVTTGHEFDRRHSRLTSMPLMLYPRHDVPRATGTPCRGSQQDKPSHLGSNGRIVVMQPGLSARLTPMPGLFQK